MHFLVEVVHVALHTFDADRDACLGEFEVGDGIEERVAADFDELRQGEQIVGWKKVTDWFWFLEQLTMR